MTHTLHGIVAAAITPMNQDESLDEAGLRTIVRYLIEHGIHGIFPGGTQGEFYALTTIERKRVLETAVEAAEGDAFIVGHVGAVTTRKAVDLAQHAESVGADAVAAITPYFIIPSQDELRDYFTEICQATSLPVLAYDNIGRTYVPLKPATVAQLARDQANFCGIKDSSGDLTQLAEHIRLCPPEFRAFVGRDSLIYGALLYGAAGSVAATANVAPKIAVGIYEAVQAGDLDKGRALQKQLAPIRMAFGLGTFPVVVKEAMQMLGLPAGPARRPVSPMSPQARRELGEILVKAGLVD